VALRIAGTTLVVFLLTELLGGCASDPLPERELPPLDVSGGRVAVTVAGPAEPADGLVREWVARSAEAVAAYLGRFPVESARVRVVASAGRGVRNGVARGFDGPSIDVELGASTTREELADDWVLTHEMLHLGFPDTSHRWLEEGLATYAEPLARARAGQLPPERVFAEILDTYAQGLPGPGDRGLDGTPTWARTYYGGAIFCLVADVEIRKRTANARGLEDAVRAIVEAGGDITQRWTIERALETGDRGAGVAVLVPLYGKLKDAPGEIDLAGLLRDLGVEHRDGALVLHDDAPLAAVRRALVRRR
jgi:hypothetical protein